MLHTSLESDRIRRVAAAVEAEAHASNWPIETAVELAVEWCVNQNEEAGLAYDDRR
jgi:hypothetical protein